MSDAFFLLMVILVRVKKKLRKRQEVSGPGLAFSLVVPLKQQTCESIFLHFLMSFAMKWSLNKVLDSFSKGAQPVVCMSCKSGI